MSGPERRDAMENPTFMLLLVEVPEAVEFELNTWYDLEHIPQMLGIDGVQTAKRFVSRNDRPKYLAWYDLDSPDILYREAALSVRPQDPRSTAWSRSMRPKMLASRRGVYEVLAMQDGSAAASKGTARTVVLLGFNATGGVPEDLFTGWFERSFKPWFADRPCGRVAHWGRIHPRARPPAEPPGDFVLCIEFYKLGCPSSSSSSSPALAEQFDVPLPQGLVQSFKATYDSLVIGASAPAPASELADLKLFASGLDSIGLHVSTTDAELIYKLALGVERAARSIPLPDDFGLEPLAGFRLPLPSANRDNDA